MKNIMLLGLAASVFACRPAHVQTAGPVIEVVVYSVKKEYIEGYSETTKQTRKLLEGIKGFRAIRTIVSIDKPGVFVDQCEWETLGDANAAAEIVQKMPEFQPIFAMMDSVYYFDHLKPISVR